MNRKLDIYIKENLENLNFKRAKACKENIFYECSTLNEDNINKYINENKSENKFQKLLFKFIDDKNLKDSDVYNKVNIDRRLFSKIRSNINYHPSKDTVILLCIALNLNEDEALELLDSASYTLPKNNVFDLIIRFCFIEHIYDINTINDYLYSYNCKLLGQN